MKKRLLATLLTLCMVLTMLPTAAFAADGYVAQIGNTTYATLDEAVEAAEEGATIELLQDCDLTKGFNKTLTFSGTGKITIDKQLTSDGEGWMCFGLGDPSRVLTFDGVEVEWTSEVGTAPWLMLSLSGTLNVTNGAKVRFTVDSGATGSRNAIYMNAGSSINVSNGSTFEIYGYDTAAKAGQALQLDQTAKSNINVTGNSTFVIDGTNRGYVNSPNIYVGNSTFIVRNCTSNGSNGGNFKAVDSTIVYKDNAGHGLSAGDVILQNSTLTADHNGLYGVYVGGKFLVDNTSELTVTNNSYGGDKAGLNINSNAASSTIKAGAEVTIIDNYCSGLSNWRTTVFEEGAKLTITGNYNDKGANSYGGGVYNDNRYGAANLTLPSDAVIYNNHAKTAGDDIYNTGTISFGPVGSNWSLDGTILTGYDEEAGESITESDGTCTDKIDGWYDDSTGNRWSAHSAPAHADLVAPPVRYSASGLLALKAAHGLEPIQPGDETGWEVSKSKTATNLDENNESQITLSLPAAEEELVSDVVFVLDESSCSEAVKGSVADMLNNLYQQIADTDATIKIGAVQFRGEVKKLPLTELTETTKDAVTKFMSKKPEIPGSNMSAGLLAGEKMLDEDNTVDNSRKYLILISDGITYIWDDKATDGQENLGINYANVDAPNQAMLAGPDGWDVKHGTKYVPNDWSQELAIIAKVMDKTITDKASYYSRDNWDHNTFVAYGEKDGYASTVDVALYKAYELYQNIASKYHSYAVMAGVESDMDYFPFGPSFMNYLADGKQVGFDDIQKDIYYLLDAGSTVEDYMGYVADDYNFNFVNDAAKLTMKVGDQTYSANPIEGEENTYGFAPNESGDYDYVLTYIPGKLTSDENFVWEINVPVSNFAPVQLSYFVKLMNPKTTPGTYGTYDEDGSEKEEGLYTNNKAILHPVDSNNQPGLPEAFAKPTVSYTVGKPVNSLTISKTVKGTADQEILGQKFTFTVQLSDGSYDYRYTDGENMGKTGTIQNGGTLTLQNGETVVIDGIPVGSRYTVSEAANRDFQTTVKKTDAANVAVLDHASAVSATGTIGVGGASAVHFVNTYSSGGSSGGGSTSTPGDNDGPGLNKQDHIAYVSGYPDGTVQPNGYITREEVATMFFRLLTDASRANYITNYNPFPDVARERWSFYSITTMNNADIMTGRTNGMFDPGANITRAEFAVVAAQFSKAQYTGPDKFSDISDHWARDYINRAAAEGWIAGYPDGTFGPERYITRAEVMALVNEVLDRAPDADYMLEDMIRWPDNPELTWYYEDVQEATNSHSYVWRNANHTVEEWKKWIPMRTYDQMVRDAFNGVGIDR